MSTCPRHWRCGTHGRGAGSRRQNGEAARIDPPASDAQFNDLRLHLPVRHPDEGNCDGQPEASRAGAAGIEEEDAAASLDEWAMGMPEYYCSIAGARGVEVEVRNLVQNEQAERPDLDLLRQREARGPIAGVDIAAYGECGSKLAQPLEHLRLSDVAGVDDEVRSGERGDRLRPNKPVRVGNDADDDVACVHAAEGVATHRLRQ